MNKVDRDALVTHLDEIRKIRDCQPHGDTRYLLNAAINRVNLVLSKPVDASSDMPEVKRELTKAEMDFFGYTLLQALSGIVVLTGCGIYLLIKHFI